MLNPRHIIHAYPDLDSLTLAGAEFWLNEANQAIQQRGAFYVALTGGSTPQSLYRLLATPDFAQRLDWSRVHIFIGDERYVAHDDPQSNFGMARQTLLDAVALPPQNIHPVATDYPQAADAAMDYAEVIQNQVPAGQGGVPEFDLIMLGMGDDGHTASLFPGTTILQEHDRLVAAVYVDKLSSWRVSMTYPLLNQARQTMVLVSGEKKSAILAHVLQQDSTVRYPIQGIDPLGELHWFVDQAAMRELDRQKETA